MANISFLGYSSPIDEIGNARGTPIPTAAPYNNTGARYIKPVYDGRIYPVFQTSPSIKGQIRSSIRSMPKIKRMRHFFGADAVAVPVAPAPIVDVQVQPVNIEPPITPAVIPPTPTEQEPAKTSAESTAEPVKNDTPQQTSITPPPDTSLATEQPAAESVSLLPLAAVAIGAYLLLRG